MIDVEYLLFSQANLHLPLPIPSPPSPPSPLTPHSLPAMFRRKSNHKKATVKYKLNFSSRMTIKA